jgi:hypothetical protein
MDDEVKEIFDEYERRAQVDADFRKRYRNYASQGYVGGTLAQVTAVDYAFVGEIPKLVKGGNLQQASDLNDKALNALVNESDEKRKVVLKLQGVSVDLLKANESFIASRKESK